MDETLQAFLAVAGGFLAASAGFWTYLMKRMRRRDQVRDANTHLLMGLAQDRLISLGMSYIERGWVTNDEFHALRHYLYEPYRELEGNGAAERLMYAVQRLPFRSSSESILEKAFKEIPIRETDSTGLPSEKNYEGEDRRGR